MVLRKGKTYPIGTVRVWSGQTVVKHADGWVAIGGTHHGKLHGQFDKPGAHGAFADQHAGKVPDAVKAPAGTPRAEAKEETKAAAPEYEFARDSKIKNLGEDIKDSARHKRGKWVGLKEAEADGTASEMVRRDVLLKSEPPQLSTQPEDCMTSLALSFALRLIPPEPDLGSLEKRHDDDIVERFDKVSAAPKKFTAGQLKAKIRAQYYDAYKQLKAKAEELSKQPIEPKAALAGMQATTSQLIKTMREDDRFSSVANQLAGYYNGPLRKTNGRSVMGNMHDFVATYKKAHGDENPDKLRLIYNGALAVMEGKSIPQAFGQKGTKAKDFDPTELYIGHASRIGPDSGISTAADAQHYLVKTAGMRGVQWGNSVTDEERFHHITKAAEAFKDLTDVLGLPAEMGAFNGRLGLAIGARGHGTALAHYEPGTVVINLTRKGGVGSLAHEWGHFFDNVLNKVGFDGQGTYASETAQYGDRTAVNPEAKAIAGHMLKLGGLFRGKFRDRLRGLDVMRNMGQAKREYWLSTREVWARSFEVYVQKKLKDAGRENTYLSGVGKNPLWPTDEELAEMTPHFDAIFATFAKSDLVKKSMDLMKARSAKQRMVMRRRPRQMAIGTVRQWQDGEHVKVGPRSWRKRAQAKSKASGGLAGLTDLLRGPTAKLNPKLTASIAQHVVNQMSTWDTGHPPMLLPLPSATAALMTTVKGDSLPWWLYCARRSAAFNDGMVDLTTIDRHVERAKRVHGDKIPEVVLHKALPGAYSGPMTVADINLASWNQFFHEGGQLNQPAWLEGSRLKDLRHQFTMLANLHGG